MARLRESSPNHPVLWGMSIAALTAVVTLLFGTGLALAPLLNAEASLWFRTNTAMQVFPVGLIVLSFCAGTLYAVLYALALQFGTEAPLLRADLKEMNRLRSEVQRLTVAKYVQKRLTNTPAPARNRSYR